VGIYRTLLKKGPLDPIEEIEGAAIESLVFQELKAYIDNHGLSLDIFFHRTKDKSEVDFVLYGEDGFFAIEVKRSTKINSFDLSSLKLFKKEYPEALAFVFYLGDDERMTDDQIHILPMRNALVNLKNILKFN
jgi:predicted AAA+ superfamily ATPase